MKTSAIHYKKLWTILCLTAASLFSPLASAEFRHFDEWTDKEKALAISYTAASYIDHRQTRVGLRQGYKEANPIYGSNPHRDKSILINTAFMAIGYAAIGYHKPDELNHLLLGGNVTRWGAVIHNDSIGVSWKVAF